MSQSGAVGRILNKKDWLLSYSPRYTIPCTRESVPIHWKSPDTGKDWRQKEKGMTEDEMVGWHPWLSGHEFEQTLGDSEGQGNLACCSPWGCKVSDWTTVSNWTTTKTEAVCQCQCPLPPLLDAMLISAILNIPGNDTVICALPYLI